jgi:hypothetical protein
LGVYFDSTRLVINNDNDGMVSEPDLEELPEVEELDDDLMRSCKKECTCWLWRREMILLMRTGCPLD